VIKMNEKIMKEYTKLPSKKEIYIIGVKAL